VRVGTKPKICY